jgi:hypothetical protein
MSKGLYFIGDIDLNYLLADQLQDGMTGKEAIAFCRLCPRFTTCSVNLCPLDLMNPERTFCTNDPERTCKWHLRDRLAVVEKAKSQGVEIPGGGFTRSEQNALEKGEATLETLLADWDALAERNHQRGQRGLLSMAKARAARTFKGASRGCSDAENASGTAPEPTQT